jgi:hypothetical protein
MHHVTELRESVENFCAPGVPAPTREGSEFTSHPG